VEVWAKRQLCPTGLNCGRAALPRRHPRSAATDGHSVGVRNFAGIATALRYAGRRGHRSAMSLPRVAQGDFKGCSESDYAAPTELILIKGLGFYRYCAPTASTVGDGRSLKMNVLRFEYEIHAYSLRAHQFPEATLAELLCDFGRVPSVAPISSEQRWAG
jgi:hypothetical protein